MELLGAASLESKWNLNFGDIATIWRGGCIIRAKFLNRIVEAYERDPALHNLLLDSYFTDIIAKTQQNWRVAVSTAVTHGVAVPAFAASLSYFDSYRQARLPRICSRRNAISSARTLMSASTSPASSTPSGWKRPTRRRKSRRTESRHSAQANRPTSCRLTFTRQPNTDKPVRRFEVTQSMKDEPLRTDPETGEPVRRVISGGMGVLVPGQLSRTVGRFLRLALRLPLGCDRHQASAVVAAR